MAEEKTPIKYTPEQELAIVKASNEMMDSAIEGMIERGVDQSIIDSVRGAMDENLRYARDKFGATETDVKNARYHGANISYIKSYEDRLRMMGKTDEDMRRKGIASVSSGPQESQEQLPTRRERNVRGAGLVEGDGSVVSESEYLEADGTPSQKRRARRKRETGKDEPVHKKEYIDTIMFDEPTETLAEPEEKKSETVDVLDSHNYGVEQFNLSDIPDYVQYDIIPLPSNGQCYKHKKGRIPVAYLTASDENIIASPNMYRDGKLLDVILRRKVLDKTVNVDELCSGDRDAIILWLRATSYGDEFPITARDAESGKNYDTVVKLSSLKYKELKLKGDEDGLLTYKTRRGDVIKFKYISKAEEDDVRDKIASEMSDFSRITAIADLETLRETVERVEMDDESRKMAEEDLGELLTLIDKDGSYVNENAEDAYPAVITEQMIRYTVSVNGNKDRGYIKTFIENLRSGDALDYRNFISENRPGVDFKITINRPESDGGGSFDTFLRLDNTVFINF